MNHTKSKEGQLYDGIKEPVWTGRFFVLWGMTIALFLVVNMYNMGMTYYIDLLEGGMHLAGLSASSFSVASLITRPFAGSFSNRYKRSTIVFISSLTFAFFTYLHQFADSVWALSVFRILQGVSFGFFSTTVAAEVNAILPRSRLAEGLGYYSISTTLAPAIGPTIFLLIVTEGDLSSFSPFFLMCTCVGITVALVALIIVLRARATSTAISKNNETSPQASESFCARTSSQSRTLCEDNSLIPAQSDSPSINDVEVTDLPKTILGFEPKTFLPAAFMCVYSLAYSAVNFFLPEFAMETSIAGSGFFFMVYVAFSVLARSFIGKVSDRFGKQRVIAAAMISVTITYSCLPFVTDAIQFCLLAIPFGLGMGAIAPLLNYYIVKRCSAARPGSASAMYYVSHDVGYTIGSLVAGMVIAQWGFGLLYEGCAMVSVIGCVLFLVIFHRYEKE